MIISHCHTGCIKDHTGSTRMQPPACNKPKSDSTELRSAEERTAPSFKQMSQITMNMSIEGLPGRLKKNHSMAMCILKPHEESNPMHAYSEAVPLQSMGFAPIIKS